jgi:anhydro-N-acetylmuramic acid kinase
MENAPGPVVEAIVSGGGARNAHLMRRLRALFAPAAAVSSDRRGMPGGAKEAACFAWLALRALDGRAGNLPAATGARGPRVLGKIVPA